MLPAALVGGLLLVRKLRQGDMVWSFCAAALVSVCVLTIMQGNNVFTELDRLLVQSPFFFFATIMLTEPLTVLQQKCGGGSMQC